MAAIPAAAGAVADTGDGTAAAAEPVPPLLEVAPGAELAAAGALAVLLAVEASPPTVFCTTVAATSAAGAAVVTEVGTSEAAVRVLTASATTCTKDPVVFVSSEMLVRPLEPKRTV